VRAGAGSATCSAPRFAATVSDDSEIDGEIRYLIDAVS
jgi:hypothetical protein